jgi:AcrR family transcriptional regulator
LNLSQWRYLQPAMKKARVRLDVDERRAQLVELGLTEFSTRTYDEISVDDIARRAGMSKGLLYHYFPTKRAYYAACVREAATRLLRRMDEAIAGSDTMLIAGLDAYLGYVKKHGRAYTVLMRGGPGVDREVARVVDETRAALLERLMRGIRTTRPGIDKPSPLLRIALHGWIGLAEETSVAWVEARTERRGKVPSANEIRDLLARALVAIVEAC